MLARESNGGARRALKEMNQGADEFMEDLARALADKGDAPTWPDEVGEAVRSAIDTIRAGRADGVVDDLAREVLGLGPDLPTAAGLAFPRPNEVPSGRTVPVAMPWFNHLDGEAAEAWRDQLSRHCRGVGMLTRALEEGMEGVELPGVKTSTAVSNCVVYGAGCLLMAGGVGLRGSVKRLAGALMAYMLFDHIGDSIDDRGLRRLVHKEMMVYWARGRWSSKPPPAAVRRVLVPMRTACERSRAWVSADRIAADRARVEPQLAQLAMAIAGDCAKEAAVPRQEVGADDEIDVAALASSLRKNVAAVAFLLFAYLDDPRQLRPRVLHMAGRAAMFAQLFDDLLDRAEDVAQGQDTAVTRLTDRRYRQLARVAAGRVPRILEDVREVAPRAAALMDAMQERRVVDAAEAGSLMIYLMTRHRNRPAFGEYGADLARRACGDASPFVVLRAVREWVATMGR